MSNDNARFVKWAVEGLWLLISTPYNAGFVSALKSDIPFADRMWDKERRLWKVADSPANRSTVRTIIADVYDVDLDDPEVRAESKAKSSEGFSTPSGESTKTKEFRRIIELERELREANRDRDHLNMVIRSLNADVSKWRRAAVGGMFGGGGGGDLLAKLFRSDHGAKVFKNLSKALHPDVGGDTELFKEVESLWSKNAPK